MKNIMSEYIRLHKDTAQKNFPAKKSDQLINNLIIKGVIAIVRMDVRKNHTSHHVKRYLYLIRFDENFVNTK